MASLTIRNLSTAPLQLTQVQRFEAVSAASVSGRGLWGYFGGGSPRSTAAGVSGSDGTEDEDGSDGGGLVAKPGEGPFARLGVSDVHIAPFAICPTDIRTADPGREVLRLTFAAEILDDSGEVTEKTVVRRYTVDIPAASPHSIALQPVDDDNDNPPSQPATRPPAFTAVYSAHGAHLAIMRHVALGSWMSQVDGTYPLSILSLPGTHNSPACYKAMPSVRCQAVDVPTQLAHGVRFLDVRVSVQPGADRRPDPRMALVHSAWAVSLAATTYFTDLHAAVCAFLDSHPTETVLMSIKREGTGRGTDADLARILLACYIGLPGATHSTPGGGSAASSTNSSTAAAAAASASPTGHSRWFTEPRIPALDEVRGRIVLVRRFLLPEDDPVFRQIHGGAGWGLDGSEWPDNCADGIAAAGRLRLQDFYGVNVASNIQRKIEYARAQLERAASQRFPALAKTITAHSASAAYPPMFLNFLSGSNFFNSSCWPEKIAARVNPAVVDYLCMRHGAAAKGPAGMDVGDGSTGIVITDWVGLDGDWSLIRCIIAWNARLQLRQ